MRDDSIELHREDFEDQELDKHVDDLMHLIGNEANVFEALTNLITVSAYRSNMHFKQQYDNWRQHNISYPLVNQKNVFDQTVEACFLVAENSFGWGKFRGTFAERLVECAFHNWCNKRNDGLAGEIYRGCAVCINGRKIEYRCAQKIEQREQCEKEHQWCPPDPKCKGNRRTVDVGRQIFLWTGVKRLDCVETKLSPDSFHYLDGAYLDLLKKKLAESGIDCKIIVASLGHASKIKTRVKLCMEDSSGIDIWDNEKIKDLYFA